MFLVFCRYNLHTHIKRKRQSNLSYDWLSVQIYSKSWTRGNRGRCL